jgi:DNA-binding NtrC family response regulator
VSGNVLIVDDEIFFRKNLLQSLPRDGFVAIGATTRQEAWAILRCYPIGIVPLDLGLPDGDGMEMLAQVRQEYPQMVVMVMTAQGTGELEGQAYRLGAPAFRRKPLSLQQLKAWLRQYRDSATHDRLTGSPSLTLTSSRVCPPSAVLEYSGQIFSARHGGNRPLLGEIPQSDIHHCCRVQDI